MESARRSGQVAIGYRQTGPAERESAGFGLVVNPPKSRRLTPAVGDRLIVIPKD